MENNPAWLDALTREFSNTCVAVLNSGYVGDIAQEAIRILANNHGMTPDGVIYWLSMASAL